MRALAVTGGVIDYRSQGRRSARQETHVNVADLSIHGAASLDGDRVAAHAAIRVRGGQADARGTFDLRTRRGQATVRAGVRGLGLAADGSIDGDRIAGRARVDATDLAVTARALARDFGLDRMPISGHGRLDVECGGTLAKPSLRASARFPALGFDDKRAKELEASARIPDLGAPDALDLDARASSVSLGAQQLRSPTVTARTAGRRVTAHVAIAAPQPLTIDLGGTRPAGDRQTLAVDVLEIRYPEATWTLRRRARLSLAGGLALTGFELHADGQRVAIDLRADDRQRTAHVVVSRLDLGRLPRALVSPALGLGGIVDASVDVRAQSGAGARPRVVATAKLAGGRIRGHRDLSLDLQARMERGRASGGFSARAPGIAATARFDLPGEWPPRNPRAPIALDVDVTDADLATVAKTLADAEGAKAARVAGQARASIKVEGRVGQPRVQVDVSGRGLAFGDRRVGDLAVSVNGEGDGQLTARLTSTAPIPVRIDLTTALSVTSVLRHPPTAEALARTPFEIKGTVDRLPLADIARAAGYPARVGGTLSVAAVGDRDAVGAPGTAAVDIAGATAQTVSAHRRAHRAGLRRWCRRGPRPCRPQAPAAAGRSSRASGCRLGRLFNSHSPARLADAPIELRAVVGPCVMQRLGLQSESERDPQRALKGRLHADLTVDGTIGAPRVALPRAGGRRLPGQDAGRLRADRGALRRPRGEARRAAGVGRTAARCTRRPR